jgi:hypothetical protein
VPFDALPELLEPLLELEPALEPELELDPESDEPREPPLSPPPPPRETALPDDSPPPAVRCARAGATLIARVVATAPTRNLPRVIDTLLEVEKQQPVCQNPALHFVRILFILARFEARRCPFRTTGLS